MTFVKICGVRRLEHALVAAEAGADLIGLIMAPSRRRIDPQGARAISEGVKAEYDIGTAGVFVNEDVRTINDLVRCCALDYVQLSGDESDEVIAAIEAPVIRVVHIPREDADDALVEWIAQIPAAHILLDTARAGSYGGTGEPFDWSSLPALPRPFLLAGGLRPETVREAIERTGAWGVDVSSGVETDSVQDAEKIKAFVAAAKRGAAARPSVLMPD